ncbi:MAG: NfeD family protein [Thermoguttaceae bacterium]
MATKVRKTLANCKLGALAGIFLTVLGIVTLGVPRALAEQVKKETPAAAKDDLAHRGKEADGPPRVGKLFKIQLPITARSVDSVRQGVVNVMQKCRDDGVRPVLVFEFSVPDEQSAFGGGSKFGNALELANLISSKELSDATTVAFLPKSIQGHAVLAMLACDQIIMSKDAEIRSAGVDEETITPTIREAYKEMAGRRHRVPEEIALKLVDRSRELLKVETDLGIEYVTPAEIKELSKRRTIVKKTVMFPAGEEARFSGTEARDIFVNYLANSRVEAAEALELPPESLREDAAAFGQWRAVRIDIKGPIRRDVIEKAKRMIDEAVRRQDANFVCLWIESAGGSPYDSMQMAEYLANLPSDKVRTVAYIPKEARADAALIAFACDEVAVHPSTYLGGEGNFDFGPAEIGDVRTTLSGQIAPKKNRSWSLTAAMIDPRLSVFRFTRGGESGFFCDEELAKQLKPDQWVKQEQVTTAGKPFFVNKGSEAVGYHLADREVPDFARFREAYGLENDPRLLAPGWVDILVDALATDAMAVLLIVIGGVGLYAELHSPGLGIGGFIALVCFVLFFWNRFLHGTANWLEVVLFVTGLVCLLMEIFVVPGFGIFGLGGGLMIVSSIVMASQTFYVPHNEYQALQLKNSLLMVAAAGVGITAVIMLINRWLPQTPFLNRMVLQPPSPQETDYAGPEAQLALFQNMVGTSGVTTTPLVPCGKARFGAALVDVIADGDFVDRGSTVVVVAVQGNRVVVRAADTARGTP